MRQSAAAPFGWTVRAHRWLTVDAPVSGALVLAFGGLLLVPLAIGAFGVRQLRRRPRVPEVAVAITPTAVQFPTLERASALARAVRAEEWPREGTTAEIRPASGPLQTALVVFTRHDGRKRRRRTVSGDNLDVDPRALVAALADPLSGERRNVGAA